MDEPSYISTTSQPNYIDSYKSQLQGTWAIKYLSHTYFLIVSLWWNKKVFIFFGSVLPLFSNLRKVIGKLCLLESLWLNDHCLHCTGKLYPTLLKIICITLRQEQIKEALCLSRLFVDVAKLLEENIDEFNAIITKRDSLPNISDWEICTKIE